MTHRIGDFINSAVQLDFSASPHEVTRHAGWQGEMTWDDAIKMVSNHPPFTYILSSLKNENSFLLTFVSSENNVQHVVFRKDEEENKWCFTNGNENEFDFIDDMIFKATHCPEGSKPTALVR
jgi:hypothetical protein